jgi:hypothetical protein
MFRVKGEGRGVYRGLMLVAFVVDSCARDVRGVGAIPESI